MAKSRNYSTRVKVTEAGWGAEIVRRASAKREIVSRQQDGFSSEADAQAWAKEQLVVFLELNERNKLKRS